MNFNAIKNLKIDLEVVESHFVTAVVQVAEEKGVPETDVSLIVCITKGSGVFNKNKEVVRAIKWSNSGKFKQEMVKIASLTKADFTGAISSSLKEILISEIDEHNRSVNLNPKDPNKTDSAKRYDSYIDKNLQLWISVDKESNLKMNLIHNGNLIREYSIKEEFANIHNSKIGDVVKEDEISEAQREMRKE